jgi:hypothetical protein
MRPGNVRQPLLLRLSLCALFAALALALAPATGDSVTPEGAVRAWPGVRADRASRRVEIEAQATGLSPGEVVEFFLVGPSSAHAYESALVANAEPGHVHAALEHIGMTAGSPADPDALRFWPRGERVRVTLSWTAADGGRRALPAERIVFDREANRTLPEEGFAFVGSRRIPDPAQPGRDAYAADLRDPRSILSAYNDKETVLDVPRRAPQGEVYNRQSLASNFPVARGTAVMVELAPERSAGPPRVLAAVLRAAPRPGEPAAGLAGVTFDLLEAEAGTTLSNAPLDRVALRWAALHREERDAHVRVELRDGLRADGARETALALSALEDVGGIRIEPPPEGHLYYRAFTPREEFRSRRMRLAQPPELELRRTAEGGLRAAATLITESWNEDRVEPELTALTQAVATPADFAHAARAHTNVSALLVFVDGAVTYGEILSFVRPVLAARSKVHVFLGHAKE